MTIRTQSESRQGSALRTRRAPLLLLLAGLFALRGIGSGTREPVDGTDEPQPEPARTEWRSALGSSAVVLAPLLLLAAAVGAVAATLEAATASGGWSGTFATETAKGSIVALVIVMNLLVVATAFGGVVRAYYSAGARETLWMMTREALRALRVCASIAGMAATACLLVSANAILLVEREDPLAVPERCTWAAFNWWSASAY